MKHFFEKYPLGCVQPLQVTGEFLLFVHIFCHKMIPNHFERDDGWMAQTFFTGKIFTLGIVPFLNLVFTGATMPSHHLLVLVLWNTIEPNE